MVKKGAMFGLDARIALAIFGALSVISGASLYSAIQNARYTAFQQDLEEISKAVQAYIIDTGSDMRDRVDVGDSASNHHEIVVKDLLVDPGVSGWGGPYLSYEAHATDIHYFERDVLGEPDANFYIYELQNGTWGDDSNFGPICVDGGNPCYKFLVIMFARNQILARELDNYIDGGDGLDKGRYRVHWLGGNVDNPVMYYQIAPTLKRR